MANRAVEQFVQDAAKLTRPDNIVWCNGSEEEYKAFINSMLKDGTLIELDQEMYPNCYLHRSDPNDVARTEHLTFVCTGSRDDAGPMNNWSPPDEMKAKLEALFNGSMKGRTMYVIPYIMGPERSLYSQIGVQVTDSRYVVVNMKIMTRMGQKALDRLGDSNSFVKGVHSLGDLHPERRFICHFPEENLIMSIGSGYGGNALLSKKCHSLRLASVTGRNEKWLAEHMLILGLESPDGDITYLTGAFPSASGKTNLAMLKPPDKYRDWKIWTLGDDIAWIHKGGDGRFWAINPEAGLFAVAPGTGMASNPHAMETLKRNTIFTNVALTPQGTPWWEGLTSEPPNGLLDWQGRPWTSGQGKAAHPNARLTTPISQIPSLPPNWEDPRGVPISAFLLGGRRAKLTPLVYEAFNWVHGVFVGATMAVETTAAAVGEVGVLRRDPMAMRPFCGYHIADYFRHWMDMGSSVANPPRIFHVNWFRTDSNGRFIWPGFSENIRVLRWINDRVKGRGKAVKTPIGYIPTPDALDLEGLNLSIETVEEILQVDNHAWLQEVEEDKKFFQSLGDRVPQQLWNELYNLESRLRE